MATSSLDQIISTGGISFPNFFNGRILSAEDLRLVRDADRRHRRLLGRALGSGVAEGFDLSRPSLGEISVTAGLAVNGEGDTIDLPQDVTLAVTGLVAGQTQVSSQVFFECGDLPSSPSGQNTFVLTVRPDSVLDGSAPADPYLAGESCGPGFEVEGVRFRRVAFDADFVAREAGITNLAPPSELRRNTLAHVFSSTRQWFDYIDGANTAHPDFGRVLRRIGIEECEVALGVFRISGGDVQNLDPWSVRRMVHLGWDSTFNDAFVAPSRYAAGLATLLQFQQQLDEIGTARLPRAVADFRFLPAAGLLYGLAIGDATSVEGALSALPPFFSRMPEDAVSVAGQPVSSSRVEHILRQGIEVAPVEFDDGASVAGSRGLPIVYAPVEESFDTGQPYGVFVSGHHPFRERVRLDFLEELVAELIPEPPEEAFVRVVYVSQTLSSLSTGTIIARSKFRIETNVPGTYDLSSSLAWQNITSPDLRFRWEITGLDSTAGRMNLTGSQNVYVVASFDRGFFGPGDFVVVDREASTASRGTATTTPTSTPGPTFGRGSTAEPTVIAISPELAVDTGSTVFDLSAERAAPDNARAALPEDVIIVRPSFDWKVSLAAQSVENPDLDDTDQHFFDLGKPPSTSPPIKTASAARFPGSFS